MNRLNDYKVLFQRDTWVKPFFTYYKKSLFLALLLGFLTVFSATALMFNSGFLISKSAARPENILLVYIPIVLTRAFGLGRPLFRYFERLVSHNWVFKMTSKIRLKLYKALESEAIFLKNNHSTGDILGILADDINHIQNLYLRTFFPSVTAYLLYLAIIIGLGWVDIWFALAVFVILAGTLIGIPVWAFVINGARLEQQKKARHLLYNELTDNVLGVGDWISSQQGDVFVNRYEDKESELHHIQQMIQRQHRKQGFLLQSIMGLLLVITLVWCSYRFPGNYGGPANWIAAFALSIFPLIDTFSSLPEAIEELNEHYDAVERLNQLPVESSLTSSVHLATDQYQFDIQQLSFAYPNTPHTVLKDINLTIPSGQKVAILGRSGAGKSTLSHLLRGDLTPSSGSVTLNHIPTAQFGDVMSDYMGVIQQQPYLFNMTILDNLKIAKNEVSEEEVWHVLDRVGLKEMVSQLPHQLNTMVDEAGLRFSGGERHRLALARLLIKDPPIILLDEPTVGLDPITEQALIQTFFKELEHKTIIWITHHLQGVHAMDRVIFIDDGHITIDGTPKELEMTNTYYQQLLAIDRGYTPTQFIHK